jgi:hypothetical protein
VQVFFPMPLFPTGAIANMALPERFSLLHSDLNGFLFAPIGREESGVPLSVLSALARLDLDPWAEGARLTNLPKEAAARALTALIARFPADRRSSSDLHEVAARLVELLPKPPADAASAGAQHARWPATWLFWLSLGFVVVTVVTRWMSLWQ